MNPAPIVRRVGIAAAVLSVLAMLVPACASADGVGKPGIGRQAGSPAMTSAPMKSNGSGVTVQYHVDEASQAGANVRILLSFDGITDPAGAVLRLTTEGGLSLGAAPATRTLPAGQATTISLDVVPSVQGIAYLHVFTTQNGATSATSIPVQVGPVKPLPGAGEVKQDAGGEKIRSMRVK